VRALDLGVTHIDTAEIYGPFLSNQHLPVKRPRSWLQHNRHYGVLPFCPFLD
jgi:aryl-alcohol dehydrogenase-like predicted oxidoreductase